MTNCPCVKRHSPPALELNVHHIKPQAWGGETTSANTVTVCMTTHGNCHRALNAVVHLAYRDGRDGTIRPRELGPVLKPYPLFVRDLTRNLLADLGWRVPKVYTAAHGGAS